MRISILSYDEVRFVMMEDKGFCPAKRNIRPILCLSTQLWKITTLVDLEELKYITEFLFQSLGQYEVLTEMLFLVLTRNIFGM